MITFVNAKINIGLQIVNRRPDGYHDLQTLFYPVGIYAGSAQNPCEFCDLLEVTAYDSESREFRLDLGGRPVDCAVEKNLVYQAAKLYMDQSGRPAFGVTIRLEKYLPDGAGMGGGSADAAFTLRAIAEAENRIFANTPGYKPLTTEELMALALQLGADCPFFILNEPAYATGVGEKLERIPLTLADKWLVVVKPQLYISTREAFAGVTPRESDFDLRRVPELPIEKWREVVKNDFEESIFPNHPELRVIKEMQYELGAQYASMTGSGSCIYGIYEDEDIARMAVARFETNPTIVGSYLLKC